MWRAAAVVFTVALSALTGLADAAGNPVQGAELHRACLGCHGTELYLPGRARAKTLPALHKAVIDWNDRMNPKFTKQEIEHIVAYLDRDFYHLTR